MTHLADIFVVVGWLVLSFAAGLWFSRRASRSTEDFFVSGRSLPWWIVGTSMVATTFAADTPLAVSGWVASKGIAENWIWWTFGLTGPAAVFLFSRMWRRSQLLTDAELVEFRYGPSAAWLRGAKAIWFGVFWNLLVVAWVMKAMVKIAQVLLNWSPETTVGQVLGWSGTSMVSQWPAATLIVGALFLLTVFYTVASGLWGVIATDMIQFVLAMGGSILLAILAWVKIGGLSGIQRGFETHEFDWSATTALLPIQDVSLDGSGAGFLVLVGVLWWSGTNIDGGGYLAQRLFAAKDDRHAMLAYLWFTVAHLVLRPWPWIVAGLVGMAWYGPISDPETYYPQLMTDLLPPGLFGLMLASFLAAFMSTIDTHLNWGASLLINDLYRRFLRRDENDAHYLFASRVAIGLLAVGGGIASFLITDIGSAWKLAISVTAGLGAVYIARWVWWRTNAWSEFSAMVTAAVCTWAFSTLGAHHPERVAALIEKTPSAVAPMEWWWLASIPAGWFSFPFSAGITVLISLPVWILVTLTTKPAKNEVLIKFFERVGPGGPGWRPIAAQAGERPDSLVTLAALMGFLKTVTTIYGSLLGVGWFITGHSLWALCALAVAGASGYYLAVQLRAEGLTANSSNIDKPVPDEGPTP